MHGYRMNPKISYGRSQAIARGYHQLILDLIQNHPIQHVCEIGGGANPLLKADINSDPNLIYSIIDISESELNKAPDTYQKIKANISATDFSTDQAYDLIFSRMLAEHIQDAPLFHRNVHSMLSPGGLAVHFFPTLYTLPFCLNLLIPEKLSDYLLNRFAPRDSYRHAKFPAYYHWCRGPLKSQIQKFQCLQYEVIEYRGCFGHPRYYDKLKWLQYLHNLKTDILLKKPQPLLTSYACVILRKL